MNTPPRKHKVFFWVLLAAYSAFFAEVFSGSTLFPFFDLWGLLVVVPLYGLHTLLLLTLIYRYGRRPTFAALVFAGALFGLYEAYITKMLWRPAWEAWLTLADVAIFEVFVLLWWHTWLSFITPLVLTEGLLTTSHQVLLALPPRVRQFYETWRGWLALAAFGAAYQSVNSPGPQVSFLSGVASVSVLAVLTLRWQKMTRGRNYALPDLLPQTRRTLAILAGWLGMWYLSHIFLVNPERIPPFWPGQAIIWGLYGVAIALFVRALRRSRQMPPPNSEETGFPSPRPLLGAGVFFVLALPLARVWLGGVAAFIIITTWLGGIGFGVWAWQRAARA